MAKQQIVPIGKEDMDKLMNEIEKTDEFDYMLFSTLRLTGRRIGELYGIEEKQEIGKKSVGKKTIYIDSVPTQIDRTIPIYKKTGRWVYGVRLKDIDFEKGVMKVWVLKRRTYIQDETILPPELARLIGGYVRKNRLTLEDYVFRKKGRTCRQIQNVIKSYAKKVGINTPITTHNFRHYFVTQLRRKGWSMEDIKVLTGHKALASLSSYEHIVADDLKEKALNDLRDI